MFQVNYISHFVRFYTLKSGTSLFASCVIFSLLGARAWKQNESCEIAFMDAALNKYDLPEENYANFNEMYEDLSQKHPTDFRPENIVANFGREKCDFTKDSFYSRFLLCKRIYDKIET